MEFIEDLINEPSCIDVWYFGNILDQCNCLESINESLEILAIVILKMVMPRT